MRVIQCVLAIVAASSVASAAPQTGAAPTRPPSQPAPAQPGPARVQRGPIPPQRRPVQVMTLGSPAFPDGGHIPAKYTQAGDESSPPLTWANVPEGVASFVLIVHDADVIASGADDTLQWMVWNLPPSTTALPEGVPQGPELPDGARQISATGPYYRGPGAAAAGPPHHYVFELYALDEMLDVPATGSSPAQTRAAVVAAMGGHVRGKGAYVGLFKRQ